MLKAYSNWDGHESTINEICRTYEFPRSWFIEYKTTQHAFHEISDEKYVEAIESKGHPFLRKTVDGVVTYITLKEFREKYMADETPDPDCDNSVGCGCFVK
jgi:hypothetical protein